jgi:putative membrane protein
LSIILTAFVTTVDRYWHHGDMGGDAWAMALLMTAFFVATVVLVVWLVRSAGGATRSESVDDILRRRLAEGAISVEEYESRRAALKKDA